MSESIDVRAVTGRRDRRRFVDYIYERNASDPHWVAPLRLGEDERLNPAEEPVLRTCGGRAAARLARQSRRRPHCGDRRSPASRDASATTPRCSDSSRPPTARSRPRCSRRRAVGEGARAGACSRTDQPVDERDVRAAGRRFRHRPDAAHAAQPAGYARARSNRPAMRRSRICSPGCTSSSGDLPPAFVRAARRLRDKHGITIRPLNLGEFTREVEPLRALYCTAWERNWGFVAPTIAEFRRHRDGDEADLRSALYRLRRGRRRMVACVVAVPDINQALKGTNGRLFPLGLIRAAAAETLHLAGAAAAARHRRAPSRPRPLSAAARRMAPADAGDAVRARRILLGPRGQPRRQPSGGNRRLRSATRRYRSTRNRCDAADRGHRCVGVHRAVTSSSTCAARGSDVVAVRRPFERAHAARRVTRRRRGRAPRRRGLGRA